MKYLFRIFIFSITFAIVTTGFVLPNKPAWSQSAAEKLYADLAKLPAAERQKRLEAGARKEGKLNIVKSLRGKLGRGHLRLFKKRYPYIKAEASEMGSQDAAERLVAEETAGRHLTDAIGMSVLDLAVILDKDLVAKYPTPATDKILKKLRKFLDPQNRWMIWYWSEHGIVYNTKLISAADAPKTWDDLCDPKFKGKVSYEPAETRYLVNLHLMMGEEKLKQWIECVGKNNPIIQRGHTTRLQLMLAGDHALSGDQYFYKGVQMKQKNSKTPFSPAWSAPILTTGGCIIINKNTPHPYAAALYADWCLSDESQKYMKSQFRGPVTLKHPYMPDDVTLIGLTVPPKLEVVERVHDYWKKYIGAKRY
jgi:iron(III) transport system substrate-binding protein